MGGEILDDEGKMKYLGHTASIEDLCILPNGLLLSCAYDKKVKVWQYQNVDDPLVKTFDKTE